jgi:L-alanine-DL-glutamate epimerase-like enolase superfamily enzyme
MSTKDTRRNWLRNAAASALGVAGGAAGGAAVSGTAPALMAAPAVITGPNMTVKKIDVTWVNVPFRPVAARNMIRELPHWTIFVIYKVTLACGVTGFGETMQYYTWRTVSDQAMARVMNHNAADFLWDDTVGCGLQQALFDAVGKAMGVPIHRLLGQKIRDRAYMSWWAIDMPGADWVLECKDAAAEGYTFFKTKARPWFDLIDQSEKLMPTLPPYLKVNYDFNATLTDAGEAVRYCTEVEKFANLAMWESPLPQDDVAANVQLRRHTRAMIAMHYGSPPPMTALKEDVCDGFVIGGGANRVKADGAVAAMANKPFFLELVGTGITAAFSMHFGSVLSHARWPQVDCHRIFTHQMIRPGITVTNGTAPVPEAPGLGVDLDEDAVANLRIEPTAKKYPYPGLLLAVRWPSGATSYYAHAEQYWDDVHSRRFPLFLRHVYLEHIPDNGSKEWKELQTRAQAGGFMVSGRPL